MEAIRAVDAEIERQVFKKIVVERACRQFGCFWEEEELTALDLEERQRFIDLAQENKNGWSMQPCSVNFNVCYDWNVEKDCLDEDGNEYISVYFEPVPQYTTDLNAVADAEAEIAKYDLDQVRYNALENICNFNKISIQRANAFERAMACLITAEKWMNS